MEIRPFQKEDIKGLETLLTATGSMVSPDEYAEAVGLSGLAFTGVVEGKVVGCAGIFPHRTGVGEAWTLMLPSTAKQYSLDLHRAVKEHLPQMVEAFGFWRIEANVKAGFVKGYKWAEALGFQLESLMPLWGPSKETYARFVWLEGVGDD